MITGKGMLMDDSKKPMLSIAEACELVKWKDRRLEAAEKEVLGGGYIYPSSFLLAQGEYQRYYMGKPVSGLMEAIEMTLSPTERELIEIARDYDDILWQDAADMGGFEAMAEAYAAGVPIEDILA